MRYKLRSQIIIDIELILDDTDNPNYDTVEYLLLEDLQDAGYNVYDMQTIDFKREIEPDDV